MNVIGPPWWLLVLCFYYGLNVSMACFADRMAFFIYLVVGVPGIVYWVDRWMDET
jgi:hypothetical protein